MTDDELMDMDTPKFPGFIVADMGSLCNTSWNYKMFKLKKLSDVSNVLLEKARNYVASPEYLKADLYLEVLFDIIKDESKIIFQLKDLIDNNPGAFPGDLDERAELIKNLANINRYCLEQVNKLKRKGGNTNVPGSMET